MLLLVFLNHQLTNKMYCSKCKYEMTKATSEGSEYYTCSQCGEVKTITLKDKE